MHTDQELTFGAGLTVLCGGNGAGKSTMLGALWRCLNSGGEESAPIPPVPHWLTEVRISGTYNGIAWSTSYEVKADRVNGKPPAPVLYVDPSTETSEILAQFRKDNSLEDLTEGVDPSSFDSKQLELFCFVLRRRYSAVRVYEITSFSQYDAPIPFFEVTSFGKTYNVLGMGRGELSAAYLLWRVTRAEQGSIILLEEPESHLASYSQDALADVIMSVIVDRDLTLVVSSHSPGFFKRLPSDHTVLLTSSPVPEVRCNLSTTDLVDHLGVSMTPLIMVVVEDVVAAEVLLSLLSRVDHALLSTISVKYAKSGESGVERTVEELVEATGSERLSVLGVLDGDRRPLAGTIVGDNYGYLVGDAAPELVLRNVLDRWRAGEYPDWEAKLPGGSSRLKMQLERLDGADHHDWLHDLGVAYGGRGKFVDCVIDLLLMQTTVREQAMTLSTWLRSAGRVDWAFYKQ